MILIKEKIKNIINNKAVELNILNSSIDDYKLNFYNAVQYKNNKFIWNNDSRDALYNIINFQLQLNELILKKQKLELEIDKIKESNSEIFDNDNDDNDENKVITKREICEKLALLWPTSTMKAITLMNEFAYMKNKHERMLIRSLQSMNKKPEPEVDNNKYEIKIYEKSGENHDNFILPRFIKSSSKFYPNRNIHYKRKVNVIGKIIPNPRSYIEKFNTNWKNTIYINNGNDCSNEMKTTLSNIPNTIAINLLETNSVLNSSKSIITSHNNKTITRTPIMNVLNPPSLNEKVSITNQDLKQNQQRKNIPSKKESLKIKKKGLNINKSKMDNNSTDDCKENIQPTDNSTNMDIKIRKKSEVCDSNLLNKHQEATINNPININKKSIIEKDQKGILIYSNYFILFSLFYFIIIFFFYFHFFFLKIILIS